MSATIWLPSTILKGGKQGGSQKASSAFGQKEPGTVPPMSFWWEMLATQQNTSPSMKTGHIRPTSGWCAVPMIGSLQSHMSPSRTPFAAVFEDVAGHHVEHPRHVLQAGAEVEELGVLGEDAGLEVADLDRDLGDGEVLDLAHVLGVGVPEAVADDLVGDRVDLGLGLAVRVRFGGTLTAPVGLKAWSTPSQNSGGRWAARRRRQGWRSRGSSTSLTRLGVEGHHEVAGRAALAAGAGRDDDPGDRQVDHGRALDDLAERHRVAVVDGGVDGAGAALEVELRACPCANSSLARRPRAGRGCSSPS